MVVESRISGNGLNGLFPFEVSQRHLIRADMGRDESAIKGTGRVSGFLMNMMGPNDDATIIRLDRSVLWTLDLRKKQYVECPLTGCQTAKPARAQQQQKPQHSERKHEPECKMSIAKKRFTVTPTGQNRSVNGFNASEYRGDWTVTLRDQAGRTSTSSLKLEVWTTPMTPSIREALQLQRDYVLRLAKAARGGAIAAKAPRDPIVVMSPEVSDALLSELGGNLTAGDRELLAAGKELDRIKGLPVHTRFDWSFDGNACATDDTAGSKPSGGNQAGGLSGIASALSGSKSGGEKPDGPLFTFTYDLKTLKVEPVRDGLFDVPKSFRRADPG